MRLVCPHCNLPARRVTGEAIYPHRPDLFAKTFWQCAPCDAYVGCHPGGDKPLGRLANATLRTAKSRAHAAFDPLWKTGVMSRSLAYDSLAKELNINKHECHIGMFDEKQCQAVLTAAKNIWAKP